MKPDKNFCDIPNMKTGLDIRVSYEVSENIVDKVPEISGKTHIIGDPRQIGSYRLIMYPKHIKIDDFHPLGYPFEDRDSWKHLKNKGISQAFMLWLCKFAEANQKELYIHTHSLLNDHIFKKWFAEDIRMIDSNPINNKGTHITSLRPLAIYNYQNVGLVEARDMEYIALAGYLKIMPLCDNHAMIREVIPSNSNFVEGIVPGVVGEINRKTSIFSVDEKDLVYLTDVTGAGIEYKGHPKIPRWVNVDFHPKEKKLGEVVCLENII